MSDNNASNVTNSAADGGVNLDLNGSISNVINTHKVESDSSDVNLNVKNSREGKPNYTSGGQMVKFGDYDALKDFLTNAKESGRLQELMKVPEGRTMNEMDAMLWYTPNYKENERNLDVVRLLIEFGANPNCMDGQGRTPLMIAAGLNDTKTMEVYIECGADIERADTGNQRPLHFAVIGEAVDAIDFLANKGVDLDRQDVLSGQTIFHVACGEALEKSVEKLMELKVDPTIEDYLDEVIAVECIPDSPDWEELFEKVEAYRTEWKANNTKPKKKM